MSPSSVSSSKSIVPSQAQESMRKHPNAYGNKYLAIALTFRVHKKHGSASVYCDHVLRRSYNFTSHPHHSSPGMLFTPVCCSPFPRPRARICTS